MAHLLADAPPTVAFLQCKPHFDALTEKQKFYAHHVSRACFLGTRITLRQVSPESESIFDLILDLAGKYSGNWSKLKDDAKVSESDVKAFLEYATQFLGNCGNYKGFGDSKFVPRLDFAAFEAIASTSERATSIFEVFGKDLWECKEDGLNYLGYTDKGHLTTYYPDSPSITKDEISAIGKFLENRNFLLENTRLRKTAKGDFELLIAASNTRSNSPTTKWELTEADGGLAGKKLTIIYGDYWKEMGNIVDQLHEAAKYAENENQKGMVKKFADSFHSGSLERYKDALRHWIKDTGPKVESNIGFVETYRDPHGVRGEWEGFVSMVNEERTKAFGKLVSGAEAMIPKLPWSKDFEKDKFLSPDFSSLEVLTFAGSGIPAGINLPNYDDIRQNEGFKNVSLGNVLSATTPNEKIPFIADEDYDLMVKYRVPAFEVQVGIHELLGHGTGKLLQETAPGVYNFDNHKPPISPVTGQKVSTWYKPGQTWSSVFGSIASSYEECRAECVAMVLCCDFEILKIFGHGDGKEDISSEAGDILYIAYLTMARAGLIATEFWDPKSKKWGQAHMQARFSILQCFLSAGDDFVKLDYKKDDLSDLVIRLDRSKILSHGRPAVEKYLQKLHIYKSTADFAAGEKLYHEMTDVDPDFWGGKVRKEVVAKKVPRKVFVQANTFLKDTEGDEDGIDGKKVVLQEYPATLEGMIESYLARAV